MIPFNRSLSSQSLWHVTASSPSWCAWSWNANSDGGGLSKVPQYCLIDVRRCPSSRSHWSFSTAAAACVYCTDNKRHTCWISLPFEPLRVNVLSELQWGKLSRLVRAASFALWRRDRLYAHVFTCVKGAEWKGRITPPLMLICSGGG